jgi:hypothetical protein
MNQPFVFISCVSPEFRQTRSRVAAVLTGEREIPGGLEAAADAGGDSKPARFVNTLPPRELSYEHRPPGISRSPTPRGRAQPRPN